MGGAIGGVAGIEVGPATGQLGSSVSIQILCMKVQTPAAHSDRMVRVGFNSVGLAVALAILGGCSFAQNQGLPEVQPQRKWLVCDVDWIFTPYDVGTDFSVNLSYHQQPLPGIRVVITPSGELRDTD